MEELSPEDIKGIQTEDRFEAFCKRLVEQQDIIRYRRTTKGHPLDMKGIDFILYSLTGRPWKFQVKSSDTGVYACIKKTREYQKKNSGRAGFVTVINGNWEEDYLRDYVLKRMYG